MDTFMDKLAQKMNAQEIIKANMAAETARMEQLQSQVEAYEALLKDMRRVNTKTVENTEQMKKVLQESLSKIEEVQTAHDEEADIKQMLAENPDFDFEKYVLESEGNTGICAYDVE